MAQVVHRGAIERIREHAARMYHPGVLVPLAADECGAALVDAVASCLREEDLDSLTIVADARWSPVGDNLVELLERATWAGVIGEVPASGRRLEQLRPLVEPVDAPMGAHVLVVYSDAVQAAVLVPTATEQTMDGPFWGFWTTLPALVRDIIEIVVDTLDEVPPLLEHVEVEMSLKTTLQLASSAALQVDSPTVEDDVSESDLSSILGILKAISSEARAHDVIYLFTKQVAAKLGIDRCSVVRATEGKKFGHVLASHDDASVADMEIELDKYPELNEALRSSQTVHIEDTASDPLTRPFYASIAASGIRSILVVPIVPSESGGTSLLLRAARRDAPFSAHDVQFCEIVAESAANALERVELVDSIQKANEELEHLARTDGLTGLFNHRYFQTRLDEEVSRATRYGTPLACMFIDVDDFKLLNDSYGHLVGDKVLRDIAARILETVRSTDIVARYGGEEFVVLLPQTNVEGARQHALRLLETVSRNSHETLGKGTMVTVSVGIAMFDSTNLNDAEALLVESDSALYLAKRRGKNRVVVGSTDYSV